MNQTEEMNIGSLTPIELEAKEAELWSKITGYFDNDCINEEIFDVITKYGSANYCIGFNKGLDTENEIEKLKETIVALENQLEEAQEYNED